MRGDSGAVGVMEGRKGGDECDLVMPAGGDGVGEAGMLDKRRNARSGASSALGDDRFDKCELGLLLVGVVGEGIPRDEGSAPSAESAGSCARDGGVDDRRRLAVRSASI